jgi:hypothetical protein
MFIHSTVQEAVMNKRSWFSIVASITTLILAVLACGGGTALTSAPPTTAAPVTGAPPPALAAPITQMTPSGTLDLLNSYGYKDSSGYYHVVGLIHNGTSQTLNSIELTLELKDASGKTLLRDSNGKAVPTINFNPALDTLAPNENSPFDYSVNTADVGEPAQNGFKVTITGQQTAQVTRAKVAVQNVQMLSDGSGSLYITGEIVNQDSQAAQLASYAVAALDSSGNVVAATDSGALTRLLAPAGDSSGNDRTAFSFQLASPGDVAKSPAVYLDAIQPGLYTPSKVTVQVTNAYFDSNKDYHIVGTMTNNDQTTLTVRLVAGLYAKDGTPLDADTLDSAFDLANGQSVPFDFNSFSVVGSLSDQAAKLDHYTVQVDPYWTFASGNGIVSIQTANDKKTDNGNGQWEIKGMVTNTAGKELGSATVVVGVYDAQGKLVAVASTVVSPKGDAMAANESDPYDIPVYLDPSANASNFTFKTFVQGIVK